MKSAGIKTVYGSASFQTDGHLDVGDKAYFADNYIPATGARPRVLDIPGNEFLLTSNDFLELEELPKRLVFLGSGYVSLELAQIANAAGAEVSVLTHGALKIRGFADEFAASYIKQLQKEGISFIDNFRLKGLNKLTQESKSLVKTIAKSLLMVLSQQSGVFQILKT